MKLLLQILFTFTISINIYSQYGLPYYERFYNDSIEAKLFKKNKIKSISDFRQNLIYNKLEKGTWWEKREYNVEGFLTKKTNPEIWIYTSGRISDDSRLDSTTYSYDSINKQIIETYHIRKSPEFTIFKFDSNGKITSVESIRNGEVTDNEIFIYNLEKNQIIEIDTNEYYRINGYIYEIINNRIYRIYHYNDKDTTLFKSINYLENKISINEYLPSNDKLIFRYFGSEGQMIKEFRESENYLIAEEYTYGNNYVKEISYSRDIESNFSIFYPEFYRITYLKENGLPDYRIERSKYHSYAFIRYFYEYYE